MCCPLGNKSRIRLIIPIKAYSIHLKKSFRDESCQMLVQIHHYKLTLSGLEGVAVNYSIYSFINYLIFRDFFSKGVGFALVFKKQISKDHTINYIV